MAYSVNWEAQVITVPRADLVYLSPNRYKLDLDEFRRKCRALEADLNGGLSYPPIIQYYPAVNTGDVILGRVVLMINGYHLELEDTAERYSALFDGANTNVHNNTLITNGIPTPNNSAGLQDLSILLASAYQGYVTLDIVNGQSGTSTPIGTVGKPVNNIQDARVIMAKLGINTLYIVGNITFTTGDDISNIIIKGLNPLLSNITIEDEADTTNAEIWSSSVTGLLDNNTALIECEVDGIQYFNGYMMRCGLTEKTIQLAGGSQASFINCYSLVAGTDTPKVDFGGTGQSAIIRGFSGGFRALNRTGSDMATLDFESGHFIVDATCTGSSITARGSFKYTVEAGATQPTLDGKTITIQDDLPTQIINKEL